MKKKAVTSAITLLALVAATNASAAPGEVRTEVKAKESSVKNAKDAKMAELAKRFPGLESTSKVKLQNAYKALEGRETSFANAQRSSLDSISNDMSRSLKSLAEVNPALKAVNASKKEAVAVLAGIAGELSKISSGDKAQFDKYTDLSKVIADAIESGKADPIREAAISILTKEKNGVSPSEKEITEKVAALKERKDKDC
jgi:hypothetical protein